MLQPKLFPDMDSCPLTSSPVGSPVRTLVPLAKVRAWTVRQADCGFKCCASSEKFDPTGCWLRMYLLYEAEALTGCSMVWKRKVTPAGRSWWVLNIVERHIDGIGCGSWPTVHGNNGNNGPSGTELGFAVGQSWPTMRCANGVMHPLRSPQAIKRYMKNANQTSPQKIEMMVSLVKDATGEGGCLNALATTGQQHAADAVEPEKNWPTCRSEDSEQTGAHGNKIDTLTSATRQWATPQATLASAGATSRSGDRKGELLLGGQAAQASPSTIGSTRGSLNARWTFQLMGWPDDYSQRLSDALRIAEMRRLIALLKDSKKSLPPGVTRADCTRLETLGHSQMPS